MKRILPFLIAAAGISTATATLTLPISVAEHAADAAAICVAKVERLHSYEAAGTRQIFTTVTLRVVEPLKGTFPERVTLKQRGGVVGERGQFQSDTPNLKPGEQRLFFLGRRDDGSLYALNGSSSAQRLPDNADADDYGPYFNRIVATIRASANDGDNVTDQAGSAVAPQGIGGFLDDAGAPGRFLRPDLGLPIQVITDMSVLPSGMTTQQATTALNNALNAWANVTSIQFKIEGDEVFGQAANGINADDGKLRIQFHDSFDVVPAGSTLGIGGRGVTLSAGSGGKVGSLDFFVANEGYVVMDHTKTSLEDPVLFEEVLTHEIGHALSLAHSSESDPENDTLLFQAIMYKTAKDDGRGATLGTHDITVIRQAYPENNTPPAGFDRVIRGITFSGTHPVPVPNSVSISGFDLQGDSLTVTSVSTMTVGSGTIAVNGNSVEYTPVGLFSDNAGSSSPNAFFEQLNFRLSDGVNLSPTVKVRVISLLGDTSPATPDGLPDSWMTTHFGDKSPTPGTSSTVDDPDNDGYTNLQEYLAGTDPNDVNSHPKITTFSPTQIQWTGQLFDYYELQASTDLKTWNTVRHVVMDGATGTLTDFTDTASPIQTFRMRRMQ